MSAGFVIHRDDFPAAADRALRMGFFQDTSDLEMERKRVFRTMTSDQAFEKFSRNGGFGLFDLKTEGAPARTDKAQQMYPKFIYMYTYAKEIGITLEARQDDPKGVIRKVWESGSDLRRTMEYTLEYLHWSWVNDNWTDVTADPVFEYQGTGYALLNEENPTQVPGLTYSNRTEANMQFNRATLQDLIQQAYANPLNERGLKQGWRGRTLLVGNSDALQAEYVLASKQIAESADNGPNVVSRYVTDMVAPLLFQDNGAWGIIADKEHTALLTFMRMGMDTENLAMDATLNTRKVIVFRTGYGAVHNKGIYGVPGV
jgi:hypothetical protein